MARINRKDLELLSAGLTIDLTEPNFNYLGGEFLTNENSQKVFSSANYEYPLKINEHNSTILKSWGQFKYDPLSLSVLGEKNTQAVKIFDKAGWE